MTPQERELIEAVAQRLRGTRLTEKDGEAERFIQSQIGTLPDALYLLTQAVIVQEQGLKHAQERIGQLEASLQQAGTAPRHGGFLSSLFGGGAAPTPPPAPPPPPPAYAPPPGGPSPVGSFLRTAAATAAGVAGGQLIFDGLRHLFGGGFDGVPGFGGGGGGFLGGPNIVNEYVPNVEEGGGAAGGRDCDTGAGDTGAGGDFQDQGEDTGGGDFDEGSDGAGGDFDDSGDSGGDFDDSADSGDSGGDF
jgi:hypothetical protein